MNLITTTPFGRRPVTAGLIEQIESAQAQSSIGHFNKWELFRELCAARAAFGVSDRDLTVLNALLSFHQNAHLSDNENLIVFPSNMALSERAHGMAESTLRRHLAALVQAGLIRRHDSPNGKRYAARSHQGDITRAFGFDLHPLLQRCEEITLAAAEVRAAAQRMKRLREDVTLMKRDALKLVVYGKEAGFAADWQSLELALLAVHRQFRRNLAFAEVESLRETVQKLLIAVRQALLITEKMDGSDVDNERHFQNSNKDSYDSEPCKEQSGGGEVAEPQAEVCADRKIPNIPLVLVLKACPDILEYEQQHPRHWHELVALAGFVRGMIGISPDAWDAAQSVMGRENAAITVASMLQRVSEIKNPGGYLRALTRKAADNGFSPGPMVMALLNQDRTVV